MSDEDKKLPVPAQRKPPMTIDDSGNTIPVRATTGIIDTIATGFQNDLQAFSYRKQANRLNRQADAVREARGVAQELKGYAKNLHALRNVDLEIAREDQTFEHDWAKEERERQRERAQWAREDETAAFADLTAQAKAETEYAKARAELAAEQAKASAQEWGQRAWDKTMPLRERRLHDKFAKATAAEEIDRVLEEQERDKLYGHERPRDQAPEIAALKQQIERIERKIEQARQTHASEGVLVALYEMKAELETELKQKTDPG